MNDSVILAVLAGIACAVFAVLWRKGQLQRFTAYVEATREELRKCTWPSVEELKGSTVVVMISIVLLGAFTVGVDILLAFMVNLMIKI